MVCIKNGYGTTFHTVSQSAKIENAIIVLLLRPTSQLVGTPEPPKKRNSCKSLECFYMRLDEASFILVLVQ